MSDPIQHGGALDAAIGRYGGERDDWLDLSTGINPKPYPLPTLPEEIWHRLPDTKAMDDCLDAARGYYGVPNGTGLVAAPGTQAIIQWLPRVLNVDHVQVVSPTYAEHAHCWKQAGCEVTEVTTLDGADGQVVILVNPNNPTGMLYDPREIADVAADLERNGATLIVDEAFCDVASLNSIISSLPQNCIVLRSFGKFFGLAGLRLGFAVGSEPIINRLHDAMGPWAVPGPALFIGARAMADEVWVSDAREQLAQMRARLQSVLGQNGFRIVGGIDLFVTVDHPDAAQICEGLARQHCLVRSFDYAPTWLRFGLPGSDAEMLRLEKALRGIAS
ncbi:MAG: threonine-phosphate decarboxylase CobD [Pseudomonadota bacterium]